MKLTITDFDYNDYDDDNYDGFINLEYSSN